MRLSNTRTATHATSLGVGFWVAASLLGQYIGNAPTRIYLLLAPYLPVIPRWTFFAPRPGNTDTRLLCRWLYEDGHTTEWESLFVPADRHWKQMFFFPNRRLEKSVTDLGQSVVKAAKVGPICTAESWEYAMLRNIVEHDLATEPLDHERIRGFQFALARDSGYDTSGEVALLFASKFEPLTTLTPQVSSRSYRFRSAAK